MEAEIFKEAVEFGRSKQLIVHALTGGASNPYLQEHRRIACATEHRGFRPSDCKERRRRSGFDNTVDKFT